MQTPTQRRASIVLEASLPNDMLLGDAAAIAEELLHSNGTATIQRSIFAIALTARCTSRRR